MSENNKLIFLDVDATLYSKEQRLVPESTIKAIHEAQENGHKVLINTGRPLVYFEKEILDIGCDGYLCSNGVHILLDGETIYHKTVPETVVEQIKRICEENNIPLVQLYQSDIYSKTNQEIYETLFNYIEDLKEVA